MKRCRDTGPPTLPWDMIVAIHHTLTSHGLYTFRDLFAWHLTNRHFWRDWIKPVYFDTLMQSAATRWQLVYAESSIGWHFVASCDLFKWREARRIVTVLKRHVPNGRESMELTHSLDSFWNTALTVEDLFTGCDVSQKIHTFAPDQKLIGESIDVIYRASRLFRAQTGWEVGVDSPDSDNDDEDDIVCPLTPHTLKHVSLDQGITMRLHKLPE